MSISNQQPTSPNDLCKSWVIYGSSKAEIPKIQRALDHLFGGYSFYPEVDWIQYGYRPPERHQVLGAWRHPKTRLFAFLLDNPKMTTIKPAIQLLIYIAGETAEISTLEPKLAALKNTFTLEDKRVKADAVMEERLERVNESKHFAVLTGVLTILTAIINGFSLYLRQLPSPQLGNSVLVGVYGIVLVMVHFAALFLLILVAVIVAAFLIKYGILLIRSV